MSAAVITVPAFASARDGVRHFFGTRRHAHSLGFDVGIPARQSGAQTHAGALSQRFMPVGGARWLGLFRKRSH